MSKITPKRPENKYIQLIPTRLYEILPDLAEQMKSIPGFEVDRLKQLISIVAVHTRKDDAAPLKMPYLTKIVPQANQYWDYLIRARIVERVGSYQPGITAYKYSFCPEIESKLTGIPLDNPKLERRIREQQKQTWKTNRIKNKKYPSQASQLGHLTIATGYTEAITLAYGDKEKSWNYAKAAATRILNGEIYYSVDDTSYRFHHNASNAPKVIRPFLRIHGPLVEIDVKNCQPYLSTLILTDPAKAAPWAKDRKFSLILETLQVTQSEDVKRYISLVNNGQFYEYFRDEYNKIKGKAIDREEAKDMMLKIFFARNSHQPRGRKEFETLFEEVGRIFALVRGDETGNKFQSYKRFAILLQRIESHLINDVIIKKRINQEYPETVAVSIYDTISTGIQTNGIEIVSNIMVQEFEKFVGYAPRLSIKNYAEKKPRAFSIKKREKEREKEGKEGGGEKEDNMILEPLQQNDNQNIKVGRSAKKIKKTVLPDGTIGPMTRDRLSLAAALGYIVRRVDSDLVHLQKKKVGNGHCTIQDLGHIKKNELFAWLSERHPLDFANDFGSYAYKLRHGLIE
ncbi:MAG: hypothetical protein V2B15_04695 [Bacteroidota bacterium]